MKDEIIHSKIQETELLHNDIFQVSKSGRFKHDKFAFVYKLYIFCSKCMYRINFVTGHTENC